MICVKKFQHKFNGCNCITKSCEELLAEYMNQESISKDQVIAIQYCNCRSYIDTILLLVYEKTMSKEKKGAYYE